MLGLAQHETAALYEPKVEVGSHVLKAGTAGKSQIPQHRGGTDHMLHISCAPKLNAPVEQLRTEARLNVERALRVPHPLQPERHHAGRRERHEMAGTHVTGVAEGAILEIGRAHV